LSAGNQIVKSTFDQPSSVNLPVLAKQNTGGLSNPNDNTKDTIALQENSRRSSGAFSVKRAKMGEPDFDYSNLNTNLR
jgi:hypothetical protein